jgi:hypothetical protein
MKHTQYNIIYPNTTKLIHYKNPIKMIKIKIKQN